jgi:23S rRNA (cytidine2498-2'-O)-methyltransferase
MTTHLVRISEVFSALTGEILGLLGAEKVKRLGSEYYLFQTAIPQAVKDSSAARFIRWHLPIRHSWPCNPEKMDGFVEKAAQSLYYKFESYNPQTLLVGRLDPGSPKQYYKALASNFRGRALQVFDLPEGSPKTAEEQNPSAPTLFCLVGKEGIFSGMSTPIEAGGLHPGGTKFISQNSDDTVSRAGAKIAEGLHFLSMHRPLPPKGSHWLELGASPGGMTSELLKRGYEVSAIDRAPLDPRLSRNKNLTFLKEDVAEFVPPRGIRYDAILSDMNGPPRNAMANVTRFKDFLNPGGLVVFTLKTTGAETIAEIDALEKEVLAIADSNGFSLITRTHLTYNRQEFTLFFGKIS